MISKYFRFEEAFVTEQRGLIDANRDYARQWQSNVIEHAGLMDATRVALGFAVHINSWVRSPALNAAVGGSNNSDHTPDDDRVGASDFTCPGFGSVYDVCSFLIHPALALPFRQLIYEHTWCHISSPRRSEAAPKRQILTLAGPGRYVPGIVLRSAL